MSIPYRNSCGQSEATCAYALQVLPAGEAATAEAHIAACPDCQRELESLRPVVDRFVAWPTDVLRPMTSVQARLARRIAEEAGKPPMVPPAGEWSEPDWDRLRPGSNASCSRPTRNGTGSACWCGSHPVPATHRIPTQASKSSTSSTVSCGSTSASCFRATTATGCPAQVMTASGARPAAPASSSPAPRILFAEASSGARCAHTANTRSR